MFTPDIVQIFGGPIDPFETSGNVYDMRSIAWSLSMQCRFGGHARQFYSVAEHCYVLSHVVPREYALVALLHDAAEAYIGDIVVPIKRRLADFKTYEVNLERSIMAYFNIKNYDEAIKVVDEYDKRIVYNEWVAFGAMPMPHRVSLLTPVDGANIFGFAQIDAYAAFLTRFEVLTGKEVE